MGPCWLVTLVVVVGIILPQLITQRRRRTRPATIMQLKLKLTHLSTILNDLPTLQMRHPSESLFKFLCNLELCNEFQLFVICSGIIRSRLIITPLKPQSTSATRLPLRTIRPRVTMLSPATTRPPQRLQFTIRRLPTPPPLRHPSEFEKRILFPPRILTFTLFCRYYSAPAYYATAAPVYTTTTYATPSYYAVTEANYYAAPTYYTTAAPSYYAEPSYYTTEAPKWRASFINFYKTIRFFQPILCCRFYSSAPAYYTTTAAPYTTTTTTTYAPVYYSSPAYTTTTETPKWIRHLNSFIFSRSNL